MDNLQQTVEQKSYLNSFSKARELAGDNLNLVGDFLIVEKIKIKEKKTKGGLILNADLVNPYKKVNQTNALAVDIPMFVKVVAVGDGYYNEETDEAVALDTKPGAIVLVGRQSIQWFASFGELDLSGNGVYELGMTKESEIKMRFKDEQTFGKFFEDINSEV